MGMRANGGVKSISSSLGSSPAFGSGCSLILYEPQMLSTILERSSSVKAIRSL